MPLTLTKAHLTQHLSNVVGLDARDAKKIVTLFFEEISTALINNEPVKLPGFGTFIPKHKTAREARNPRTGESVLIPDRRVAIFKSARSLRVKLQEPDFE